MTLAENRDDEMMVSHRRESACHPPVRCPAPLVRPSGHLSPTALKASVKSHYDSVASTWREKVWVADPEIAHAIRSFCGLSGEESVLDVGTGAGDFTAFLPGSCKVIGLDISYGILLECRRLHPHLPLVQADAELLPFQADTFDAVSSRNLLQCFVDPTPPVAEMLRVAKLQGIILIVESAVHHYERQFPTEVCRVVEPMHPLFPSHELLHELVKSAGARVVEQRILGIRRKWLGKWQRAKQATEAQRHEIYKICKSYPRWYRDKYRFKFYPAECEIESVLTFSLLRARKCPNESVD